MSENELSRTIVDLCFKIHKNLGPGLFESVYEEVLCIELNRSNLQYSRQKPIGISYEGIPLNIGFIADIIVEDKVIIEIKSVETIKSVHHKQLLTYLKLTNLKLGLLINFNTSLLKDGVKRIVNNL